ncbi:MAG TPA: hypothetical protein PK692_03425 [Bacteroidales bacterium]|nr:hypothetical protein [Bacteroidales bacterium]HQO07098.1 hypothetical protein [Bacteroidales bacterium]HQP54105.1 hypothetical protein [Bacteroidales bacterium]
MQSFTKVERAFSSKIERRHPVNIPYIIVENYPKLGLLTALRFIEWVNENPYGVISLPTGKTPESFIFWAKKILSEWDTTGGKKLREENGLLISKKPNFNNLHFVQIDEYYPVGSQQHNSFYHFVEKNYIENFGLDKSKGQFINCDMIALAEGRHFSEIFPNGIVDLNLRFREAKTSKEKLQQESIFILDEWCSNYEQKVRDLGGIGFFLGGIGPDGHIAFNTRGSDHHSTTRLTRANYETQAAAAGDLGGIEISKNRLIITIGLQTITFNPEATAIIFAAGEGKAPMVANALEEAPSNLNPASALAKLKNARFYITHGAASMLKDYKYHYFASTPWNQQKTDRAIMDLCEKINKFGEHLTIDDLKKDEYCSMIPNLDHHTVQNVINSVKQKIERGTFTFSKQRILYTGPNHDDIILGLLPHIHRLSRNETNRSHFAVMTSGADTVTNKFLIKSLEDTLNFLNADQIQMVNYPDFFEKGYKYKRDKDIYHYLIKVASGQPEERRRGFSHRMVRNIVEIWSVESIQQLRDKIEDILTITRMSYGGQKLPPQVQALKGMIREFEEELVWAFFGMTSNEVHHLHLTFNVDNAANYKQEITTILSKLQQIQPTVISVVLNPEGSGPNVYYKSLQAIAAALIEWGKTKDLSEVRIWGYRNILHKFHPAEVTHIVPVSLNAMGVLNESFTNSYLSQVSASFPNYKLDGKLSDLSKQIWVEQLKSVQFLLGKAFFYQNESPRLRTTHGLLFFNEMNVDEFLLKVKDLKLFIEG